MISSKPLWIRFDKIDGFVRIYDRTKYLVLLAPEKYNAIYNRIRYKKYKSLKSGITDVFFSLLCKNQSQFLWLFPYKKSINFT